MSSYQYRESHCENKTVARFPILLRHRGPALQGCRPTLTPRLHMYSTVSSWLCVILNPLWWYDDGIKMSNDISRNSVAHSEQRRREWYEQLHLLMLIYVYWLSWYSTNRFNLALGGGPYFSYYLSIQMESVVCWIWIHVLFEQHI